jgi:uncharacterized protein
MTKTLKTATLSALLVAATSTTALAADIRAERVTFTSGGETLVGTLYLPAGASATAPKDAIVVTGAWMTIKEQMAGTYARELAKRGFAALAFDFRSWGESSGTQRAMENPAMKIADIQAAVRYLDGRRDIADIGGLGICASAGYMVHAALNGQGPKAIALVAPWLHDGAIVEQVYGGRAAVDGLIAQSRQAQALFARTGEQNLVPAAGPQGSNAVMAGVPYYTETDRGLIPQWENRFNIASWEGWLTFDALAPAARLQAPTKIIHSDAAAIPQGARSFYAQLTAPKAQLWLDGIGQLDFYDRPEPVRQAADAAAAHFRASL